MIYKIRVIGISETDDYSFYLETRGRKKITSEDIKKFMETNSDQYPYNLNHAALSFYSIQTTKIIDKRRDK